MSYITDKQIFYVNSRFRTNASETDSNFSYNFNINPNIDYDSVVLLAASIPKTYYLIQSNNNTFTLKENTSQITITIPVGNYNVTSFKTVLTALLNSNSPNGYIYSTQVANAATSAEVGKYTFSVSNNGAIQPIFIFASGLYEVMGFNINSSNQFSSNTLISTNVVNFSREATLFIHSDICQNDSSDNVLQEIYTAGEPTYSYINFTNQNVLDYSKNYTGNANTYRFYLTDENGGIIDLNGINLNLTIMIFKSNKIDELTEKYIKFKTME